jgi:NAD(P)-dependent dehydrogenase (short-subunit alcohol dehydrogenase family)
MKNVTIIGASGSIGQAVITQLIKDSSVISILALSRKAQTYPSDKVTVGTIDLSDEESITHAATLAAQLGPQHLVFITTGFLHGNDLKPEKSIRDLSIDSFLKNFEVNTIGPALVAKHFLPIMAKGERNVFATLSARVGSISDNNLGGWYAYRASKAALNMVLKNLSIESARKYKNTIILGLHPGTVDSELSKPFQKNVAENKLFTPEFSASKLLDVIDQTEIDDSGDIFAWDGKKIEP